MLTEESGAAGLEPSAGEGAQSPEDSQAVRVLLGSADDRAASEPSVEVRPIRGEAELDEVYRITHDAFLEHGYCKVQPDGRLIHYPHLDRIPETTILVALIDGAIGGTLSLTLEGPQGLHVDSDFRAECDAIRREGRRLAAAWRLATRSSCRDERRVVMALILGALRGIFDAGVQTTVFTFNPRHERVYQRLLNMKIVARKQGTDGLENAPAVFMRMDAETVPERWRKACQTHEALRGL
jgi:hypothetical protein